MGRRQSLIFMGYFTMIFWILAGSIYAAADDEMRILKALAFYMITALILEGIKLKIKN